MLPAIEVEVTADTAKAEAGLKRVSGAVDQVSAKAVRSGKAMSGAGVAMGNMARSANPHGLRNIALQLNQVGQQAAVTGNFLQALSIQLPDLFMGFAGIGAAVAGAALGLGVSLVPALIASKDETKAFEENLDSLNEIMSTIDQTFGLITASASELQERFGAASEQVREFAILEAQLVVADVNQKLSEQIALIGDLAGKYETASTGGHVYKNTIKSLISDFGLARDQAVQFETALSSLRNAASLDEQRDAARQLVSLMGALNIEAGALPDKMRQSLIQFVQLSNKVSEAQAAANRLNDVMAQGTGIAQSLKNIAGSISFDGATKSASGLVAQLSTAWQYAVGVAQALADQAAAQASLGEGGSFSQINLDRAAYGAGKVASAKTFDNANFSASLPSLPSVGGGGGSVGGGGAVVNPLVSDIEALRDALATETEVIRETYEQQAEILASAREQNLIGQEEFQQLSQRSKEAYLQAMAELDRGYHGSALDQAGAFFGDMASAFANGNEKMLKISKTFGAAEALINAWRAYNQVIADPTLPFAAKLAAGANVLTSAMAAVSAIEGVSAGGSSSGGGGGGSAAASAATTVTNVSEIRFMGSLGADGASLVSLINEEYERGNFVRATVA